jgi:hypothetical protein
VDPTWAGIIIGAASALAGVVVSTVAEHFRSRESFKREKAWSVSEEKRERLEKLWETLDEIRTHFVGRYYLTLEAIELQTPVTADGVRAPITRFRMLTQLYLPHLGEKAEVVERSASALGGECARASPR